MARGRRLQPISALSGRIPDSRLIHTKFAARSSRLDVHWCYVLYLDHHVEHADRHNVRRVRERNGEERCEEDLHQALDSC